MKKLLVKYVLLVALVIGFASSASAAQQITVKKGDSMWLIAKRYNVSFAEVLRLNNHYSDVNMIHVGDKINIPDGSHGTTASQPSHSDNIQQGNASAIAGSVEAKENAVLQLVNKERTAHGLKELVLSTKLTSLAEMKSEDMAKNNYFSHTSPTLGSPFEMMQKHGVTYKTAGENIAAGQKSAEDVMNSWMNSSGHRANILNASYTEIGIGYYAGGSYRTYWTQEFIGK